MSVTESDIDYAHELFALLGQITSRKMMGGLTLYCDGVVFSILDQDATLYLKARGDFADEMATAGSLQFGAESGKTMCYWTLPDNAIDDTDAALDWAKRALCAL